MKKGFTLVEIILSITLITIIGISGFFMYKTDKKEKTLEIMKEEIYRAVNVLIETDAETKKQLYNSKNGAIIPLAKLESEGLIDFNGLDIKDEYVLSMLGSAEESEKCSGTLYNIGSWTKAKDDVIYICGGNTTSKDDYPDGLKEAIIYNAEKADGSTARSVLDEKNILSAANRLVKSDSKYIFKGDVMDNYVNFNGMCWRIVYIQSDGSVKLLLQDKDSTCDGAGYNSAWSIGQGHFGYKLDYVSDSSGNKSNKQYILANYLDSDDKENSMKNKLDKWFDENFSSEIQEKLKYEEWSITDTSGGYQIFSPLGYENTNYDKLSLINLYFVGYDFFGDGYYLSPGNRNIKYTKNTSFSSFVATIHSEDYQAYMSGGNWFTLGIAYFNTTGDGIFDVTADGLNKSTNLVQNGFVSSEIYGTIPDYDVLLFGGDPKDSKNIRPAIVLKSGTKISGGYGTQVKPYVVE